MGLDAPEPRPLLDSKPWAPHGGLSGLLLAALAPLRAWLLAQPKRTARYAHSVAQLLALATYAAALLTIVAMYRASRRVGPPRRTPTVTRRRWARLRIFGSVTWPLAAAALYASVWDWPFKNAAYAPSEALVMALVLVVLGAGVTGVISWLTHKVFLPAYYGLSDDGNDGSVEAVEADGDDGDSDRKGEEEVEGRTLPRQRKLSAQDAIERLVHIGSLVFAGAALHAFLADWPLLGHLRSLAHEAVASAPLLIPYFFHIVLGLGFFVFGVCLWLTWRVPTCQPWPQPEPDDDADGSGLGSRRRRGVVARKLRRWLVQPPIAAGYILGAVFATFYEFGAWPIVAGAQWLKSTVSDAVSKLGREHLVAAGAYVIATLLYRLAHAYAHRETAKRRMLDEVEQQLSSAAASKSRFDESQRRRPRQPPTAAAPTAAGRYSNLQPLPTPRYYKGDRLSRLASKGERSLAGQLSGRRHPYERLALLSRELNKVLRDLDQAPTRMYTIEEWTWYLTLISAAEEEQEKDGVGERNRPPARPLASIIDTEPQWVFQRLTEALEMELNKVKKEEKVVRQYRIWSGIRKR